MSGKQYINGKSFEFSIINALNSISLHIIKDSEYIKAQNCYNKLFSGSEKDRRLISRFDLYAHKFVKEISKIESKLKHSKCWITNDTVGKSGDSRDIVLLKSVIQKLEFRVNIIVNI